MSHNIEHFTYAENIHRDYVKRELDNYVAHADWQEGCSGLYNSIRWLDTMPICEDEEAARAAIERLDRRNYDNLAVRFYRPVCQKTKGLETMKQKTKAAYEDYITRDREIWAETVKAEFVGCKGCGSKISRVHIRGNRCPVCHADLRPKTTLKAVAAAEARWRKAVDAEKTYEKQHGKKAVMWLVKIEYHT